jgi:hypothetical protein
MQPDRFFNFFNIEKQYRTIQLLLFASCQQKYDNIFKYPFIGTDKKVLELVDIQFILLRVD